MPGNVVHASPGPGKGRAAVTNRYAVTRGGCRLHACRAVARSPATNWHTSREITVGRATIMNQGIMQTFVLRVCAHEPPEHCKTPAPQPEGAWQNCIPPAPQKEPRNCQTLAFMLSSDRSPSCAARTTSSASTLRRMRDVPSLARVIAISLSVSAARREGRDQLMSAQVRARKRARSYRN